MAWICPTCETPHLEAGEGLELPADALWDEISFRLAACSTCGFRAAAVYQESRRGSLEDDTWQHAGYSLDPSTYDLLRDMLRACPNPADKRCACPVHHQLGQTDPHGEWNGLQPYTPGAQFWIRVEQC